MFGAPEIKASSIININAIWGRVERTSSELSQTQVLALELTDPHEAPWCAATGSLNIIYSLLFFQSTYTHTQHIHTNNGQISSNTGVS